MLAGWIAWRAGFFINVPIGIVMMLAAKRYISETETHAGAFDRPGRPRRSVAAGLTARTAMMAGALALMLAPIVPKR